MGEKSFLKCVICKLETRFKLQFMPQNRSVAPKIALGILGCELVGVLATIWSLPGLRDWYPALMKPPWAPPASWFSPIWIGFYALLGIAIGLVWAKEPRTARENRGIFWFWVQLALSVVWCAVFFGARATGWAYAIVILLWLSVAATLWIFSKISRVAGLLLVPYFAWITLVSALNFATLSLNYLRPAVQKMDKDPRNGPPNIKPGVTLR